MSVMTKWLIGAWIGALAWILIFDAYSGDWHSFWADFLCAILGLVFGMLAAHLTRER